MTNLTTFFPDLVATPGGGGMNALYKAIDYTLVADDLVYSEDGLTHTLPATPIEGDKCSVWDVSDNAGVSAITILRNGETIMGSADDFSLNMSGGRVDFLYNGTTWLYSYVVQTIQPSTTITRTKTFLLRPEIELKLGVTTPATLVANKVYTAVYFETAAYAFTADFENTGGFFAMPDDWDGGSLRARAIWSPNGTSVLEARFTIAFSPADDTGTVTAPDVTLIMNDNGQGVADAIQISPWSTAVVPTTMVASSPCGLRCIRGTTTIVGTITLVALEIEYTATETLTAAVSNNPSAVTRIVTGITDTLLESDNGKEIIYTNGAAIAVTLPDGFPEGWNCVISQAGAGVPTVTPATDTVNGAGTGVAPAAQWKGMYLSKYSATAYMAKF